MTAATRTRAAIVLTASSAGQTTPEVTVYIVGPAPARRLYATVIARAMLDEGNGHVVEEHVRVSEQGARTTRLR